MATDPATLGCRLPGCGGPRSGVCINGLPFDECPDVIELSGEGDEVAPDDTIAPSTLAVALPGGRSLDASACDALLRKRGGAVVGVVAGPDVGKTTLIATMYELLLRRRMKAFGFAGSETLRGYEERCHLARISSRSSKPDTHRTPVGVGLNFTHLRVASATGVRDVLFSDRSGESFENALSRPVELRGFIELYRANVIILLVDLVRLVAETHVTVSKVRRLFMALDQSEQLEGSKVLLVGTKSDVAMPTARSKKAGQELENLGQELNKRAAGRFAVGRHVVACRARRGSTMIGEGVEALLTDLLASGPPRPVQPDESWPTGPSELDKLMRGYRSRHP